MIGLVGLRGWACWAAFFSWMTASSLYWVAGVAQNLGFYYLVLIFGLLLWPPAAHCLRAGYFRFIIGRKKVLKWKMAFVLFEVIVLSGLSALSVCLVEHLHGVVAILALVFTMAFITLAELAVLDQKDFGLSDMFHGILLGLLSAVVMADLQVIFLVSFACYVRKLVFTFLQEDSPNPAANPLLSRIQSDFDAMVFHYDELNLVLKALMPDFDWEQCQQFVAMTGAMNSVGKNVRALSGAMETKVSATVIGSNGD